MEKQEHWEKIKELLGAALEREPSQRVAFLNDACGENESLRAEVESLLSAHAKSDNLSEHPWSSHSLDGTRDLKSIGPYHLQRKLGEGGMGQVWLAEQTSPVQRQVALKLVKADMYDDSVLQRFQSERQSLAMMDHPAIAKVFDAGTTPEGQPYFVMEYVAGLPITDYCNQHKLGIRERLALFIETCDGVQHAHQKAIIHRDLKPANILVVEVDGNPMPRIIDFGLAKVLTPQLEGQTMFTQAGAFLGTPGYMSPEQADAQRQDVDTRTDVYSLGVVLYALLTGSLPFDTSRKRPLDEVLRQLREEDPPRPSTKVSTAAKEASADTAAERGTQPRQLASQLRGDLDWITMKAVERDRARRYGSPSEFAADIQRYLRNKPVKARPASTAYRMRKYVRRHRIGVTAAAVIGVVLIASAVAQAIQLRRITRERDRANRITEFMTSMFKVSDPRAARGNSVTAREILDKASKDIETGLAKDPQLQAEMMHTMGAVYTNLGLYARAQQLLEQSVKIGRASLGAENPQTLRAANALGWTLMQQGHLAEAGKLERETLEAQQRALGANNADTLSTMDQLAVTLQLEGKFAEAEPLARMSFEGQRRLLGPENDQTLVAMDNLVGALGRQGKLAEAEQLERETLQIQLRVNGPNSLQALSSMMNLAVTVNYLGHHAEAETMLRQALDIETRNFGPDQPETAITRYNLACVLSQVSRFDEAFAQLQEAVDHGANPRIDLNLARDPDLNALHADPRFDALVAHAKQVAASKGPN